MRPSSTSAPSWTGLQEKLGLQRSEKRKAELEARSMAGGPDRRPSRPSWPALKARQAASKGVNSGLEMPPKQ